MEFPARLKYYRAEVAVQASLDKYLLMFCKLK